MGNNRENINPENGETVNHENGETINPKNGETVNPENGETVNHENGETVNLENINLTSEGKLYMIGEKLILLRQFREKIKTLKVLTNTFAVIVKLVLSHL
jgi:hypothetical protein